MAAKPTWVWWLAGAGVVAGGALLARGALTLEQLRTIMPKLSAAKATEYLPPLLAAMREASITTPARAAAFLAQLAHESGELRYWQELGDVSTKYEGRADLGNVYPGDSAKFSGKGPIQLTGRANYRAAGKALGLDLEGQPQLAATPPVGFRVAAWFWTSRGLNAFADKGDFREITRRINGGFNGLDERLAYWARAKQALGVQS